MRKAFITGVTGQDGSYLAELLLDKQYDVVGMDVNLSPEHLQNINHISNKITLIEGDIQNRDLLLKSIKTHQPDEIYNFASISFVPDSWDSTVTTLGVNAEGVVNLLEGIRRTNKRIKIFQASSSEMFGAPRTHPQNLETPLFPRNPYAAAKAYAHWLVTCYRSAYNIFAISGILFNHESPRRPTSFVTRKITSHVAKIKYGLCDKLALGNLDTRRDWGFAGDYVNAIWLMMQQEEPEDYILGTGETHSVREFCELAFGYAGLDYQEYVIQDPRYYREEGEHILVADPILTFRKLHWMPRIDFQGLVKMMVEADCALLETTIA